MGRSSLDNYTFFGCRYPINQVVNDQDKSILMTALYFHPRREEKFGIGAKDVHAIKVYKIL